MTKATMVNQSKRAYASIAGWRLTLKGVARASTILLACVAHDAWAQSAASPPAAGLPRPTSTAPAKSLETIVVTAEKRRVNVQKVPISVVALSARTLAARGITSTGDLSASVPGLIINNPANVGNPYLRGVGSNLFDPSSENAVALYIDGVYIAAPESNLFGFNNIQRIEVLKGPQGTLFGRNATGGVIQIITKDPSQKPSAEVSLGSGNYDTLSSSLYATGGLTPNIAADVAVLYDNQGQGYGHNLTTGAQTFQNAVGNISARSKFVYTPDADTKIRLAIDYAHTVSTANYQKPEGVFSPIGGSTYPGAYNAVGDLNDRNRVNTGGASVTIDHDFGFARLVDITAYRTTNVIYALDFDVTKYKVADLILVPQEHNWSEEVQLVSPDKSWLKWLLGGYYYGSSGAYRPVFTDGAKTVADQQITNSYSVFGQTTASFFGTNFTAGLRYTTETQDYNLTYPVSFSENQTFHKLTYRASIDRALFDDVLAYASYNRGFKSGGFNLLLPGDKFRPETLDATEIGLKSQFFDHRVRLNLAAFYYNYADLQLDLPTLAGNVVTNAAAAHIKGVEGDFSVLPIDDLTISGGLSYLDGRYTNYPGAVPLSANGVPGLPGNAAGHRTAVTPPVTATLNADYRYDTPVGAFRPAVSVTYNDGFFWQADNRLVQPAYTLVNASLTWTAPSERYSVEIWGRNLTNSTYYIARIGVAGIGDAQEQAPPLTFGGTLRLKL